MGQNEHHTGILHCTLLYPKKASENDKALSPQPHIITAANGILKQETPTCWANSGDSCITDPLKGLELPLTVAGK